MKTKKYIIFTILFLTSTYGFGQQKIKPYVDERVELLSTVFRVLGAQEYSDRNNVEYVKEIEKDFGAYQKTPFFNDLLKMRNKDGIGYDAVMEMAVNLKINKGKVSLLDTKKSAPLKRWNRAQIPAFIKGLNDFYVKSNFHQFYKNHAADYVQASKAYSDSILSKFKQDWYVKFYGKEPNEDYKIVIGYGNGGGNYGPRVSPKVGRDTVYAIVSGGKFTGREVNFSSAYASTLIHEFNHSFVNYILDSQDYAKQLEPAGTKILNAVKEPMSNQAYRDWKTVINESLVRAAVLVYMKENHFSEAAIKAEYEEQILRGFFWMNDLVNLLEEYETKRQQYPTLESFYPRIVSFFNTVGKNIDEVVANQPRVARLEPAINNKNDVDRKSVV